MGQTHTDTHRMDDIATFGATNGAGSFAAPDLRNPNTLAGETQNAPAMPRAGLSAALQRMIRRIRRLAQRLGAAMQALGQKMQA